MGVILMRVGLQLMWIHDCCVPIGVWICCCTAVLVCLVGYGTCGLAKATCSVVMPGTFSEFLVLTGVADGFIFKGKGASSAAVFSWKVSGGAESCCCEDALMQLCFKVWTLVAPFCVKAPSTERTSISYEFVPTVLLLLMSLLL